jgi:signal transduction histidine kinase
MAFLSLLAACALMFDVPRAPESGLMQTLMTRAEKQSRSQWPGYVVAIACAIIALPMILFREGPAAELNLRLLLLAGVMFSSWFGGLGPGLLTTIVTSLTIMYAYAPTGHFVSADLDHIVRLIEFVIVALLITFLNDRRREAQRRAESAQAQAESANRAKDEFLATVSHELRTPLTAILGWANVFKMEWSNKALSYRALEAIERNARKQQELIEDLLDISRITAGQLHLDTYPIDLADVIEAATEVVRPAMNAKGLRLRTCMPDDSRRVMGDDQRLQQVIWNLLSNAVKFTSDGGVIEVHLDYTDSHARIIIRDSGNGIDVDLLPHVFERFRQGELLKKRHGGVGLGLAIARELVESHGGSIAVRNVEPTGAEFTIHLPLANITHELCLVRAQAATASAAL